MKVLVYGDIGGSGGYIRYCKGLFASNAIPADIDVCFVCSPDFYNKLAPLDKRVKVVVHPWISSKSRMQRYLWHLWIYPRFVRSWRPEIEFFPAGVRRVYLRNTLSVTTCHNLLLFDQSELDKVEDESERSYFVKAKNYQSKSFENSDGVIFLSEHSQNLVCNLLPSINSSTVVAHGLDVDFLRTDDRAYDIRKSVNVLYVSPIYRYKHQTEVMKAITMARYLTGININIKFIGGGSKSESDKLRAMIKSEKAESYMHMVGSMPYEDLLKEYNAADLFVFASSCETFGITLLEAMGAKLPIACSNRTGLEGILKDAGTYFDPEDPHSIASALIYLLENLNLRRELGVKAFKYAQRYTWESCAGKTFDFIKQVYGAKSR